MFYNVCPKGLSLRRCVLGAAMVLLGTFAFTTTVSADVTTQTVSQSGSIARGDDYPGYLKNAAPDAIVDPWWLYNRECTSFVGWRLSSVNGYDLSPAYGNADYWGPHARQDGILVDKTPALGSVAWWDDCHVAWVSAVYPDSVEIEEYNYGYNHAYHKRVIPISSVDGFIHFQDLTGSPSPVSSNFVRETLATQGTYTFTDDGIVRSDAKTVSPEVARYGIGQSVHYDKVVESDGYRWISYVSFTGVRRYVAVEALPKPTTGTITISHQDSLSGTFEVTVSNVSHNAGVTEVQVPIWSETSGQDDLIWYTAKKQADGTYKVSVDIANHHQDRSLYHIHLYYLTTDGQQVGVSGTDVTV